MSVGLRATAPIADTVHSLEHAEAIGRFQSWYCAATVRGGRSSLQNFFAGSLTVVIGPV
jgi:hypothetical protein